MFRFSQISLSNLDRVDTRLLRIVYRAIKVVDFRVICGVRSREDQERAFASGKSKLKFPNSKHNIYPPERFESQAVDLLPYPIPGRAGSILHLKDYMSQDELMFDIAERASFYFLSGVIKSIAHDINFPIRWGGDFNSNLNFTDDNFTDLAHFELI